MNDAAEKGRDAPRRGVKIVCTLGPRSSSPETIRALVAAGMDVARLNFSHGSHEEHAERVRVVREAADLRLVREAQRPLGDPAPLVAKIETAAAIANLGEVLEATDAVMLARGDLALETPFERVPMEQKRILAAARRRGRPVVTATQMLVSMVTEPQPTRAEVNDVANAVLDGTDAVMLSEETAVGADPAHVVRTMAKIALYTESCRTPELLGPEGLPPPLHDLAVAAEGAARMARQVGARAIVAWSQSGLAARLLSRAGPGLPIVAPTPRLETARQLAVVRDVTPVLVTGDRAPEDRVRHGFGIVGAEEGWVVVFGHERGEEGRRLPWTRMARLEEPASWLGAVGPRE